MWEVPVSLRDVLEDAVNIITFIKYLSSNARLFTGLWQNAYSTIPHTEFPWLSWRKALGWLSCKLSLSFSWNTIFTEKNDYEIVVILIKYLTKIFWKMNKQSELVMSKNNKQINWQYLLSMIKLQVEGRNQNFGKLVSATVILKASQHCKPKVKF